MSKLVIISSLTLYLISISKFVALAFMNNKNDKENL